jgi:hypothetical protein
MLRGGDQRVSTGSCCERPRARRRWGEVAGSVIPAAILVLLPKCPACLAAYLAAGAGIGVTLSGAAQLRSFFLLGSVACLAWLGSRWAARWLGRGFQPSR